jgi:hypothetical protein
MLAYLASEDPDPLTRERALAPAGARGGGVMRCSPASRTFRER